ncbi:MAG TPA: hypothetical protein VLM76_15240 [Patescibacteria group bacterium]|nr:hypothetical protein [Patescibacteria group bacterium]
MREVRDRIWHAHLKDGDSAVVEAWRVNTWHGPQAAWHGVFCEFGMGWRTSRGVLRVLDVIGYDGWIVVEQDLLPGLGSPLESARRDRDLRSVGG